MTVSPVIEWLLEPSEPSVRYRTLRELLDIAPSDSEVQAAQWAIAESPPVVQLLAKMHPDGYWLQKNPSSGRLIGDGVEYGSFGTTHFCLAYLAELGLERTHPQVLLAAERYLSLQQPDGDWLLHFSCLYGYNLRTYIMLGYRNDERVQKTIRLMEGAVRSDGGYLCDMHAPAADRLPAAVERPAAKRTPKSCIRGSLKALAAFSALGPAYWSHPTCLKLVDYFLSRGGIYQRRQPDQLVNKDVGAAIFPIHWRAGLVEVLYHLSVMGYGNDPRLERAWQLLESKTDESGRYRLDWSPAQNPWNVGKRGAANKWITLYALLAKKAAARLKI